MAANSEEQMLPSTLYSLTIHAPVPSFLWLKTRHVYRTAIRY